MGFFKTRLSVENQITELMLENEKLHIINSNIIVFNNYK